MRQYDNAEKDDRIQRTLDRMALLRQIDEDVSQRKKLQAKSALAISPVDHPQEKEADAVAKKVVSGEDAKTEMNSSLVNVQMKSEDGMLAGTEQLQTSLNSSKGSGTPLDAKTQNEIGGKMGADLSDVKIHTDSKAHEMSEGINAKAFTHGQDIYFKQGNFDTNSNQGKELLAHELTHTVQQKGAVQRKIQKKDDEPRKSYSIAIPQGTVSKRGFQNYAELIIFGKVVNITWVDSVGAAEVYADITNNIGTTVVFNVLVSTLEQYGVSTGSQDIKDTEEANKSYSGLAGGVKNEIVDEIDKRYYESTGIKEGTAIEPGDKDNVAVWNKFKLEVMKEKELIDGLSLDMKKFLHIENGVKPQDYAKYASVVELLSQFDLPDFLDYQSKVSFETDDLEMLRKSLEGYLAAKEERKAESLSRESIKTKLYGLEELYKKYKSFKGGEGGYESIPSRDEFGVEDPNRDVLKNAEEEERNVLTLEMQANGFRSIEEFGQYVRDYEMAFEQETVRIADDHLLRYRHFLYEEKKKLEDDAYVSSLFEALNSSGAKEHYNEGDTQEDLANGIVGVDGKLTQGDRELKQSHRDNASAARGQGDVAIRALPSPLVKEDQFDREGFADVSSKEGVKAFLQSYILEKEQSIRETWQDIHLNPEYIYELDTLFDASVAMQGIEPDSIYDMIVRDKFAELNAGNVLAAICLIIISIALVIVSFGTLTPFVAAAAAGISAGISVYGIYEAAEEYKDKNDANNVGLLTEDPSLVWVVLAIAGAVLDVAALAAVFKAAKPVADATKLFDEGGDIIKLQDDLNAITELGDQVRKNIVAAAEAKLKARNMIQGMFKMGNTLNMVILPGGAEFAKLVATAYYLAKQGVINFGSFLLELKAAKLIDDITALTADQKRILKEAFEKGKSVTKANPYLAGEIDNAIANGDFVTLEKLLTGFDNAGEVGTYTTKIKWGIQNINARPFDKGYWGERIAQTEPRIEAFELKINPNDESFYLQNSEGSFVQFENLTSKTLQDGKLVMNKSSIYHVLDKPDFLRIESILKPAQRQVDAAKRVGYTVEWLVSDQKAVDQLTQYFIDNNIEIVVKLLPE